MGVPSVSLLHLCPLGPFSASKYAATLGRSLCGETTDPRRDGLSHRRVDSLPVWASQNGQILQHRHVNLIVFFGQIF